jgi:hypothetical protein
MVVSVGPKIGKLLQGVQRLRLVRSIKGKGTGPKCDGNQGLRGTVLPSGSSQAHYIFFELEFTRKHRECKIKLKLDACQYLKGFIHLFSFVQITVHVHPRPPASTQPQRRGK